MSNNITYINWQVTNYCTGGCSYCHSKNWGGEEPKEIKHYVSITERMISHFTNIGRKIHWRFDGGDPLEIFEFPKVLKMCKEAEGHISLNTAGGKLWLEWWAWEPYVDDLNLTYHYWQNPSLIRYVVQNFKAKNKSFRVSVPVRVDYFDDDVARAKKLEEEMEIPVSLMPLYIDGHAFAGLHKYSKEQLEVFFGPAKVEEKVVDQDKTLAQRFEAVARSSPIYTGQLCNVGIERLNISADGWVSGSDCGNDHLGNIYNGDIRLPAGPQRCKMQSCMSDADRRITKFKD